MSRNPVVRLIACAALSFGLGLPLGAKAATETCAEDLTQEIPSRAAQAPSGSNLMQQMRDVSGTARDKAVVREMLAGNMPGFLRQLQPVSISGTLSSGQQVMVTLCVTPEYLAIGSDQDFVRMPMGLTAAARVAQEFGFYLPTPKMVDHIYGQAQLRVAPSPMKPTDQMSSTAYLVQHNQTVERQFASVGSTRALAAGHKKDLVLSNRLRTKQGRVAIYGWHRTNGKPIQPLSTVHGAEYADYSHGVRLVSRVAYVNGAPQPLEDIIRHRELSHIVSDEGPIDNVQDLLANLTR